MQIHAGIQNTEYAAQLPAMASSNRATVRFS